MVSIPTHGPPTHPGVMLLEEFLKPLGVSQVELAERIGVSFPRVNELIHGKRGMTPDTALRLERLLRDGGPVLAEPADGLGPLPRGAFSARPGDPKDPAPAGDDRRGTDVNVARPPRPPDRAERPHIVRRDVAAV